MSVSLLTGNEEVRRGCVWPTGARAAAQGVGDQPRVRVPGRPYIHEQCRVPASLFFFFQAEDGIRDLTVTGVQTCALPISVRGSCASQLLELEVRHQRVAATWTGRPGRPRPTNRSASIAAQVIPKLIRDRDRKSVV